MKSNFKLNELNNFTGSTCFFEHWGNKKLVYTEGIAYLANKLDCYWLIEEIAYVILPKLLQDHEDCFYNINFFVNENSSAIISIDDGNGNVHFNHKINWTDFPIVGENVQFYLCDSGNQYCFMLPGEY